MKPFATLTFKTAPFNHIWLSSSKVFLIKQRKATVELLISIINSDFVKWYVISALNLDVLILLSQLIPGNRLRYSMRNQSMFWENLTAHIEYAIHVTEVCCMCVYKLEWVVGAPHFHSKMSAGCPQSLEVQSLRLPRHSASKLWGKTHS